MGNHEEAFPDSWVATTGPIALGMLTDIFCMIVMHYEVADARKMWPIVMGQMQRWAVGCPLTIQHRITPWNPCEALVRIGCKEISRLSETLITLLPRMEDNDAKIWLNVLCRNLSETLSYSSELEGKLHIEFNNIADVKRNAVENKEQSNDAGVAANYDDRVCTPYGLGNILDRRLDKYSSSQDIEINVIRLDSGATLYAPRNSFPNERNENSLSGSEIQITPSNVDASESLHVTYSEDSLPKSNNLDEYISPLRVRCTAAYCLQKCLLDFIDLFSTNCEKDEVSGLIDALEKSRVVASKASVDKGLSASFEEAILVEWGDKAEDKTKAFSSDKGIGHLRRSEMFFLTQESCANNVLIHFLARLYCPTNDLSLNNWDTVSFAAPLLMDRMSDVLHKFIQSEREDGHRIDPNVWRAASESGGIFGVHCTSFAVVVVNILSTLMKFSDAQFNDQKSKLFPILCSLITIHSSEIRELVAVVMNRKVSVLLGINTE